MYSGPWVWLLDPFGTCLKKLNISYEHVIWHNMNIHIKEPHFHFHSHTWVSFDPFEFCLFANIKNFITQYEDVIKSKPFLKFWRRRHNYDQLQIFIGAWGWSLQKNTFVHQTPPPSTYGLWLMYVCFAVNQFFIK